MTKPDDMGPPDELKFLIYGAGGWIGGLLVEELTSQGLPFEIGRARLEDRAAIEADIERVKPTRILNAAGITGRPNVDWCEDNRQTCVRGNVIGTLNLADVCDQHGIHMIYFGTGCIFHYDEDFPEGSGKGFKEEDKPNFTGSYYSHCKAMTENLLQAFNHVLTLRVRMPIVQDLTYPRNFINKIIKYQKVVDIPNSMTVLPELLSMSIEMSKRKLTGIMNYTNPGAVSHNEILQMYKDLLDPDFTWENFTIEEQAKVIVAPRSNNLLDTARLQSEFPEVLGIKESIKKHVFDPLIADKDNVVTAVNKMRAEFRKN